MKKMILSVFAVTAFVSASYAQTEKVAPPADGAVQAAPQDARTQVDAAALPDVIKGTLATDAYKEWKVVSAWQITGAAEYYILEMQKGEERTTLKFDKEGKLIG